MNNPILNEVAATYRLTSEQTNRERSAIRRATLVEDCDVSVNQQEHSVTISLVDHMQRTRLVLDLKEDVRFLATMVANCRRQLAALKDQCEAYTLGVADGMARVCEDLEWLADQAVTIRNGVEAVRSKHDIRTRGDNGKADHECAGQVQDGRVQPDA